MPVAFEERERALIATLSGVYTEKNVYELEFGAITDRLRAKPQRVVINLHDVIDMNPKCMTALEVLCWKLAKNIGQQVRLAQPSRAMRTRLGEPNNASDIIDEDAPAHTYEYLAVPVYESVVDAFNSFDKADH